MSADVGWFEIRFPACTEEKLRKLAFDKVPLVLEFDDTASIVRLREIGAPKEDMR